MRKLILFVVVLLSVVSTMKAATAWQDKTFYIVNGGHSYSEEPDGSGGTNGTETAINDGNGNIVLNIPWGADLTPRFGLAIHQNGATTYDNGTYGTCQIGTTEYGGSFVFKWEYNSSTIIPYPDIPWYNVYVVDVLPIPEPEPETPNLPPVISLPRPAPELPPYIIEDPYYPFPVLPEYGLPVWNPIIPDLPSEPVFPDLPIAPTNKPAPDIPVNPDIPDYTPPDDPGTAPGGGSAGGGSGGDVTIIGKTTDVYDQEQYRATTAGIDALKARELSSGEIALKIKDVLDANGIKDDVIELRVQSALNEQGLTDYRIGLAVKDALYSQALNAAAIGEAVEWGLGQRQVSAAEIAEQIKNALESIGLNTDGMENSMQTALNNQDLSAGNFQIAFETAMNKVGSSADGTELAVEKALEYRNLSAAEIGLEVGNQMQGLGLSTAENDNLNAQSIVDAIEGIGVASNDNSGVIAAIESLGDGTAGTVDQTAFATNFMDEAAITNSILSEMQVRDSEANGLIGSASTWVTELFVFEPPSLGKSYSMVIDFGGWSSQSLDLQIPVYTLDLSHPAIAKFRAVEVFALWIGVLISVAAILKDTFSA